MMEWQHIETAPKDGRLVLLYLRGADGNGLPAVATWLPEPQGWFAPWLPSRFVHLDGFEPVYWVHLPDSPKEDR